MTNAMYTEKEVELARKYIRGECNETQFNYIMCMENIDKKKMEKIISELSYVEPMATAAKLMLAYMFLHFMACLIFSLMSYLRG
jgi:hypothetical protein